MQWATSHIKYKPSPDELYQPPKAGYSIRAYRRSLGRFIARRGRGKDGFTKNACFYSIEDAREWLDNLPEYPDLPEPVGREWTKDYRFQNHMWIKRSGELNLGT
jgi:hypothetical protein